MAEFRTSARAVDMLGRQQIAGIPSAISELFKNAHDAYANNTEADFIRYKDLLVLRDDGDGMSRHDFEHRWLTLGTSSKVTRSNPSDNHRGRKRAILGEKGIGRLAIASIGPQTLIITKAMGNPAVVSLIHWGVFELVHAHLSEIRVPVEELSQGAVPDLKKMGQQILDNLKELITEDDDDLFERIERDMALWRSTSLDEISQLCGFDIKDFEKGTVFIIQPTSKDLAADLEEPSPKEAAPLLRTLIGFANTMTPDHEKPELKTVFRDHRAPDDVMDLIQDQEFFTVREFLNADHHFQGEFDEYGQFSGAVTIFGNESISFPIAWTAARGEKTQCGPFRLNLAYIQGRAKQSKLDANDYYLITQKLDRYGGLYIYRDGIRVLPYGDSRFDWLDVELRRTKSASDHFFSYRRMFGAVEISREKNSKLREKAGREGFATNEAYRQFRSILQNFLVQVAAEFFREGGAQAEIWEEGRLANERMEKARRVRSKQVRQRRKDYSAELERFFESMDASEPETKIGHIKNELIADLDSAKKENAPSDAAERFIRAEMKARSKLRELKNELQVKRPRGVALSAELMRRTSAYEAIRAEVLSTVIEPAEREIETLINAAGMTVDKGVHRRLRFDRLIKDEVHRAHSNVDSARNNLRKEIKNLHKKSQEAINESHRLTKETTETSLQKASTTKVSKLSDEEFTQIRSVLETNIRNVASEQFESLESLIRQVKAMTWNSPSAGVEDTVSSIDQIEQLETRVETLTERATQDFELVQIGMAVNIVTHEFENSIKSVRDNLRRLRNWAKENPGLRPLYSDLRASFDHLDSYLKLFTPLHRRLYREPVLIRGEDVQRYLLDVFTQRLKANEIKLTMSDSFVKMRVKMYPSTLYPVIVNLVDNAVYWLQNYPGERNISLDKKDSSITVADSGPGISLGDQEAIFEQGFSRKPAGSGYGLYIAREVLRRDGADLELLSTRADQGTEIKIVLPNEVD